MNKPFSPGGSVTLQARGFAKPFGGRVGPSYGMTWPPGNAFSISGNTNQQTDPLVPSRDTAQGGVAPTDPNGDLANHSRFPGDPLGMKSLRAISSMINRAQSAITINTPPFAWASYNHLGGLQSLQATGDSLARDATTSDGNVPANQRPFEVAALAPDAFDILHYSIEPLYFENYYGQRNASGGPLINDTDKIYDYGSTKDNAQNSQQNYNVQQQIQEAQGVYGSGTINYIVREWQHLLTGWTQAGAADFSFPQGKFGLCAQPVAENNKEFPTTGNCISGGRVGYSIKPVSFDYLRRGDHEFGGEGAGTGPILNPPPNQL